MSRLAFLALAAALIVAGLILRLVPWGLPLSVHHYGGGLLWGAMVFTLVASVRPLHWSLYSVTAVSLGFVVLIEGSRLYHTPALDAFRTSLPGQLLLGRIFSPWNILADSVGVVIAAAATWRNPRGLAAGNRI